MKINLKISTMSKFNSKFDEERNKCNAKNLISFYIR